MTGEPSPSAVLRQARQAAGLSQVQLARRLGTTQSALARLEASTSNPTVETLDRTLAATGHRLRLTIEPRPSSVDESLIRRQLELTPAQRLAGLEAMHREARALAVAGARARGELG